MEQHIFFVDDEPEVCQIIGETIKELGFKVSCFISPTKCLDRLRSKKKCHLLITDLKMPEKDGIELLKDVKHLTPWIPVLIVTGYGDVHAAVKAMKAGAVDFIEKPLDKENFAKKIRSILEKNPVTHPDIGTALTQKELIILRLIIDGKSNKEIADILQRSVRTIEVHRAHIMQKMGVDNMNALFKRAALMGLIDIE
jgi:FixJ family two-component response regulator